MNYCTRSSKSFLLRGLLLMEKCYTAFFMTVLSLSVNAHALPGKAGGQWMSKGL